MKKVMFFLAVLGVVMLPTVALQAQEEDLEYSYGVVVKVADDEIALREYDYDTDQEVEISYVVNPETKVGENKTIKDIVVNDNVEIYYKETDGKKIVSRIDKEEIPEETGNADDEVGSEEDAMIESESDVPEAAESMVNQVVNPEVPAAVEAVPEAVKEVVSEVVTNLDVPVVTPEVK